MSNKKPDNIISGRGLTPEEQFYLDWGKETVKNNIDLCNDIFGKLITLNSILAGGSILQTAISVPHYKMVLALVFLLSLLVALVGIFPWRQKVDINNPYEIENFKNKVLNRKIILLQASAFLLVAGIFISAIFVILNY